MMGRPKKNNKKRLTKKNPRDPRIEEIYEKEITFYCPVRGWVTQKVKVKRYKPVNKDDKLLAAPPIKEIVEGLEQQDNGLSIYDPEDIGVTGDDK